VLADEYAMVNHELHRNLLDALPRGGCLRAFGDLNQLKPIESIASLRSQPSSFEQILKKFPSVRLEKNYRQEEGSTIAKNGLNILAKRMPVRADDFEIKITNDPIKDLISIIERGVDFLDLSNQIITLQRPRAYGVNRINRVLQLHLNPNVNKADGYDLPRHKWAKEDELTTVWVGDKVIITSNNYELDVLNGETGIITEITDTADIIVDFGDRQVTIPLCIEIEINETRTIYLYPQKDMELAYAITTHKSQGSEYKQVAYVMHKSGSYLACRPNFYTGITRAKEKVFLLTDQETMGKALRMESPPEK
jgi:exodeoxyribonuclease V alpha subunit